MTKRELAVIEAVRDVTWPTLQEILKFTLPNGQLVEQTWGRECCVAGSRIAKEILEDYYIGSVAMKAKVIIYSPRAWEWEMSGRPPEREPDPAKDCIKFCGFTEASETAAGWLNGHVVLLVENELLLDTTCQQFSQPDRGIPFVEPVLADLATDVGHEWMKNRHDTGFAVSIEYGALVYAEHHDLSLLYDAPDWSRWNPDRDRIKALVKERVAERLELYDL